jgi:2',3'-cyclic-nucleotide 3'-phosphodiesterase
MAPGKLSLWLVPSEKDAQPLQKLMTPPPRSVELDPASYPTFYPHVTLASISSAPSSISSAKNQLASWLELHSTQGGPFIPFEQVKVSMGDRYFQSVYIACQRTEELAEMHRMFLPEGEQEIKEALKYPHLSLCYITNLDKEERTRFYDNLLSKGRDKENTGSVEAADLGEEEQWLMKGFKAEEVWFMNCDGPAEQWYVVDKVSLLPI